MPIFFGKSGAFRIIFPSLLAIFLFLVTVFALFLPAFESSLLNQKKTMLHELTATGCSILELYHAQERDGRLGRAQAQELALGEIRGLRYGPEGKDYFWINDLDQRMLMHPYRLDLEGQDLSNFQDPGGKYLVAEFVRTVREQGAGYVSYLWQRRDNAAQIAPKLSHVKLFAPWGWVLGTGVYLDDVEQEIATLTRNLLYSSSLILLVVSLLLLSIVQQGLRARRQRLAAQEELLHHRDQLQELVATRTAELTRTNLALGKEIEEKRLAEEEKRQLQLQLIHHEKMRAIGTLAAGIAHELNTPTQYIGDNLHFLGESFTQLAAILRQYQELDRQAIKIPQLASLRQELARQREAADLDYLLEEIPIALRQSREGNLRVHEIVNSIRDFSQPGSQAMVESDLNLAIANTVAVTRNAWQQIATIATDLQPDLPAIPCYINEFNQVILHLIMNGVDAIGKAINSGQLAAGAGQIRFATRLQPQTLLITVEDNGIGIPEENLPKIFDPFFTTKGVGEGSGQGLAIAYAVIARKHQGQIAVNSQVGTGTRFTITLPIWQPDPTPPTVIPDPTPGT